MVFLAIGSKSLRRSREAAQLAISTNGRFSNTEDYFLGAEKRRCGLCLEHLQVWKWIWTLQPVVPQPIVDWGQTCCKFVLTIIRERSELRGTSSSSADAPEHYRPTCLTGTEGKPHNHADPSIAVTWPPKCTIYCRFIVMKVILGALLHGFFGIFPGISIYAAITI